MLAFLGTMLFLIALAATGCGLIFAAGWDWWKGE